MTELLNTKIDNNFKSKEERLLIFLVSEINLLDEYYENITDKTLRKHIKIALDKLEELLKSQIHSQDKLSNEKCEKLMKLIHKIVDNIKLNFSNNLRVQL